MSELTASEKLNNKTLPLVSIITTCLNSELYIQETFESVLKQDYPNLEYIVIDGASTDNTLKIIKEYEPLFKETMIWHSETDKGIYDAFNKGIMASKGEIISLLNSDDYYDDSNVVSLIVEAISDYDFAHGAMRIVSAEGQPLKVYGRKNGNIQRYLWAPFNHPTMFVRREVYDRLGMFDARFRTAGDYDFMLRLIQHEAKDVYIDKVLTNFRTVGVTSSTTEFRSPDEIKTILRANGLSESLSCLLVWMRISRAKLLNRLTKYPYLIRAIRKLLPYHTQGS